MKEENIQGKRECELKYRLCSIMEELKLIEQIKGMGFNFKSNNLESDYTPDVEGFLCRKNGLMLRFRVLEGTVNDVLLTLKIKGSSKEVQDNYEIETLFSQFDENKFAHINNILNEATQCTLDEDIKSRLTMQDIRQYLSQHQFSQYRMFTQKKRKEYVSKTGEKITLDEFPRNIGKFLEIETSTPEELFKIIRMLGLNKDNFEKRNYGEIVKDSQKDLPEFQRRTCIFEDVEIER